MKRLFSITLFFATSWFITPATAQERGFVHPGGLHTQDDFDRVKAQIAAGNTKVKRAFQILQSASYAQPTVTTSPTETIVRGGSGENYMNAARATTMAYQNALRWKLEGNQQCANAAVRILMAWANKTKAIGGDSNYALAAGLYGYQFAQAAELMRDYEGWSRTDFTTFQQWMLDVWYPSSLGFLCKRNGSWENSSKWWQAPGHYWSNWGLANAMCVALIGILCDDVFIYNQGMSFFKYDQVGTFTIPPTLHEVTGHGDADGGQCIHNDGLTEFLGNLVVTTSQVESLKLEVKSGGEVEAGGYGFMGQLNESGRDAGHSALSAGLAVDMAKIGWSQGDDLFAYMDHRLAAGIEYLAAQTQSAQGLPWTDYMYGTNGYYYSDSRAWLMTEPVLGAGIRPYWGAVIGIYEGVKGVKMPFSEVAYTQMGIDGGGQGSTSGGYDHMGYSVLMNTRDVQLCPAEKVPTELKPKMIFSGTLTKDLIPSLENEKSRGLVAGNTLLHNELGGLVNSYTTNNNTRVRTGETLTLMPQLPDGEEDSGQWVWNTGETTRNIVVTTDRSYIYRVTYTNARGIKSQLCFAIATETGDGIDAIETGKWTMDNSQCTIYHAKGFYNLLGQRVSATSASSVSAVIPQGIYIVNGKKVIVK
ncbi:MAG: alginate lyase family protein [Prevotella sp.]|nr:alginate lyase family protein [Prevotella sp.]